VSQDRTDNTKKKERKKQQERERERTREKKRHEKELERTRESFNQKHLNHKSTTFCSREKKTQKTLSLNTSNGEPRSGGNLERVTREKRERGACLIVCVVVFSLFSFSLIKEARAKSAKDSVPLNEVTPYLRRVFVDPKQIIKRDESFSLFSIVLFPRTRGRRRRFLLLLCCFLLSSSPNLSSLFTTRSRKSRFCDHTCSDLLRPLLTHTLPNRRAWTARRKIHSGPRSRSGRLYV
jgi:hypothetical protein